LLLLLGTSLYAQDLDAALENPRGDLQPLHQAWLKRHGDFQPLLDALKKIDSPAARWVEARTVRARGDTKEALALFEKLAEGGDPEATWIRAQLLDALGLPKQAEQAYKTIIESGGTYAPPARLRLALLDKKGDALIEYVKERDDADVSRRTAIVLGLIGRAKEAVDLYEVRGEGSKRFRQEARVAQWCLESKQPAEAREAAWRALRAAKLSRDRRYALGLLVEAYRGKKKLDALIDEFARSRDLPREARDVWMDLLRERSRVDEAMRLLKRGELTAEMRRDLLELCREAGRDELVVETYRALMTAEPRVFEWPAGLSRYHLERAEREQAIAIWDRILKKTGDPSDILTIARLTMDLGLDSIAEQAAERGAATEEVRYESLILLFDLFRNRGLMRDSEEQLQRVDRTAPPNHPARLTLAEAYEGIGAKRRAADILLALRAARGPEKSEEDLDMRLAVLLAEVGDDEAALQLWRELWVKAASIPRRTYIEDRMLTVASRIGKLADIAIDLEEKLVAGEVSNLEAGLLVKIYTKAGDAISAAEVIQEHVKRTGGGEKKTLTEKARVYLANADYYNYERTLRSLMKLDPEGRAEYLRHLAMSNLERGQAQEARRTLAELKALDGGSDSAEFEAGVLALAGLDQDAMEAYRRGLATYPDRIEVYLLLANLMVKRARTERAIGMFQNLAETSEKDDLFTVAIDGLLNVDAPPPVINWARRVTLARIAARPDKNYLYQLYSDLSEELRDTPGMLRAGEAALPSAGERRGSILRELVELARPRQSNTWVIVGGVATRQTSGGSSADQLRFGRRLLHLRELVPPGVFLELGRAFLSADDVASAEQTFRSARDVPDYAAFQRQVAQTFEESGYLEQARRVYARLLLAEGTDIELLAKVAELYEATGKDARARGLFDRALELILSRRPMSVAKAAKKDKSRWGFYWAKNVDEFDQHYDRVLRGMLTTLEDPPTLLARQRDRIVEDKARLGKLESELGKHPALRDRAAYLRRVAFATGAIAAADELDRMLLGWFPEDRELLEKLVRLRLDWGLVLSARRLMESGKREDKDRLAFLFAGKREGEVTGVLAPEEASRLFLPLLIAGENERARRLLRSVSFAGLSKRDLEIAPRLVAIAVYLRDPDATLTFGRHWLAAILRHAEPRELQQGVMRAFQECFVVLDQPQRVSLARSLADLVVSDPKKAAGALYTLNQIQIAVGEPLFDVEQIKTLLKEGGGMTFVYQPATLVGTVPERDRVAILEELWTKVPKNFRANFVFSLLSGLQEPFSDPVRRFVLEKFHESVDDIDIKRHRYLLQSGLMQKHANSATALAIAELLHKRHKDDPIVRAGYAAALWNAGRKEEARPMARELLAQVILGKLADPQLRWPLDRFRTELGAEGNRIAMEIIQAEEKKSGPAKITTDERLKILTQQRDQLKLLAAIEKAVEDHPDVAAYKSRLASQYSILGRSVDSLLLIEELLEKEPKNKAYRRRLASGWKRMRNPERAKRFEEEKKATQAKSASEKVPASNVLEVSKAVKANEMEPARLLWRRFWRNFQLKPSPYPMPAYWQLNNLMMQKWPREQATVAKLYRGGIPVETKEEEKVEPPPAAVVAIAEYDFGADELGRHVRTLGVESLDSAALLFDGLAAAAVRTKGREAAIAATAELLRSGNARKADSAVLLKLLEDDPEPDADLRALLQEIVGAVNVYDYETARRLARAHARTGAKKQAAVLYRWCVTQLHANDDFFGRPDTRKLVEEAAEQLEGDDRIEIVELILDSSRPTLQPYFNRDFQQSLEIRTWEKVLGAKKALSKTRALCEKAAGKPSPVRRQSARAAAILLAAGGEHDLALRALVNGIGRLDPANVERPTSRYVYYNAYQFLPQPLSSNEMLRLFPVDASKEWCRAAADAVAEWSAQDLLEPRTATRLQALLAARLHAAGEKQAARWLVEQAEKRSQGDPATRVWVLDAWRALGESGKADSLERELLDARCLPLARIPEALARLDESERESARKKVAEYTQLN
jgi:thioredoxin-like negative regulator of GroEL